jgi:hypothetical protein
VTTDTHEGQDSAGYRTSCVTQSGGNYFVYIYKTEEPLCFTRGTAETTAARLANPV